MALWCASAWLVACGPPPPSGTCRATWSGALAGSADCSDATPAVVGARTASSLTWADDVDTDTFFGIIGFHLPHDVAAGAYTGADTEAPSCTASAMVKPQNGHSFVARSQPSGPLPVAGTCVLTFNRVIDHGARTEQDFEVHGTAEATMVSDQEPGTVTLHYDF